MPSIEDFVPLNSLDPVILTMALSFVLMSHYFCGNGMQVHVPTVLLTPAFFPALLQKQDYHLLFRSKSDSGAINVLVAIILIQWLLFIYH